MAEILLASGHWREAPLLHSSVGGVCKGADNRTDALRADPPTDRPFNG